MDKGEPLSIYYPAGGTVVTPRPAMIMNTAPNMDGSTERAGWLGYYSGVLGCSDDFQDIADGLTEKFILGGDPTQLVNNVRLVKMPGDYVSSSASDSVVAYPVGAEVISYCGSDYIVYREANYEWDTHTRMDD